MITRSNLLVKNSSHEELQEEYLESDVIVINNEYALDIEGDEWEFRKFTGKSKTGVPIIDLDKCLRFTAVFHFPKDVDLEWLMSATLLQIIRRYSKGAYEN